MKPDSQYKKGDKIGGQYQVHKVLMSGMGEAYHCLDLETNYPFALKTFQQRYLTACAFEQNVSAKKENLP